MSDRNFDGGVRFVIKSRGSAITSLTLTLTHLIYYKATSFNSFCSNPLNFYSIISSNFYSFSFIYPISLIFNYSIISTFNISIIISTTLTGLFNTTITPRGIIITNLSLISIFIITTIPILTIITITLHPP